jgi:CRISPR-associated protein Csb1
LDHTAKAVLVNLEAHPGVAVQAPLRWRNRRKSFRFPSGTGSCGEPFDLEDVRGLCSPAGSSTPYPGTLPGTRLELQQLLDCVETRSVIRLQVDLSCVSPDGLVCPPTYAAPRKGEPPYIPYRKAYIDGQQRNVVVLDSPQSQSNRIELALLAAVRAGRIKYPNIEIAFPGLEGEPTYSVLQLSHRIYDAVMRAVTLDRQPFFETPIGRALLAARPERACALLEHAPICLTLGAWDSNGGGGPLSAKIPRLLTSESLGLDAVPADISATKFDPMDIRSQVAELMPTDDPV